VVQLVDDSEILAENLPLPVELMTRRGVEELEVEDDEIL
jgi:hypothetical protein